MHRGLIGKMSQKLCVSHTLILLPWLDIVDPEPKKANLFGPSTQTSEN